MGRVGGGGRVWTHRGSGPGGGHNRRVPVNK